MSYTTVNKRLTGSTVSDNGLKIYFDLDNPRCYRGGNYVTNGISSNTNAYPSFGMGWGTFENRQYVAVNNVAVNWNIAGKGTTNTASVNNSTHVVTTSAAHGFNTYDLINPATTGGGLTTNTYYFVRKLSDTTYTLHLPKGSLTQSSSGEGNLGLLGFNHNSAARWKIHHNVDHDIRVAINGTSFPTESKSIAHVVGSSLIKEIIRNGFTGILGQDPTDCVRLHCFRNDLGTTQPAGMAYGVTPSVTTNGDYYLTFWARAMTPNLAGAQITSEVYFNTTKRTVYGTHTLGEVGEWKPYYVSVPDATADETVQFYFWSKKNNSMLDISNIQFSTNQSHRLATTSRSSYDNSIVNLSSNFGSYNNPEYTTAGLLKTDGTQGDLDPSFDVAGAYRINQTDTFSHKLRGSFTYEAWLYHNADNSPAYDKIIVGKEGSNVGLMAWKTFGESTNLNPKLVFSVRTNHYLKVPSLTSYGTPTTGGSLPYNTTYGVSAFADSQDYSGTNYFTNMMNPIGCTTQTTTNNNTSKLDLNFSLDGRTRTLYVIVATGGLGGFPVTSGTGTYSQYIVTFPASATPDLDRTYTLSVTTVPSTAKPASSTSEVGIATAQGSTNKSLYYQTQYCYKYHDPTTYYDKWYHLVGTYEDLPSSERGMKFYIDGQLVSNVAGTGVGAGTGTLSFVAASGPLSKQRGLQSYGDVLTVGCAPITDTGYTIDGKIPISRVYNRALTDKEVANNYNAEKWKFE